MQIVIKDFKGQEKGWSCDFECVPMLAIFTLALCTILAPCLFTKFYLFLVGFYLLSQATIIFYCGFERALKVCKNRSLCGGMLQMSYMETLDLVFFIYLMTMCPMVYTVKPFIVALLVWGTIMKFLGWNGVVFSWVSRVGVEFLDTMLVFIGKVRSRLSGMQFSY